LSKDQTIGGVILAVCVIVVIVYLMTLFFPQWLGSIGLINAANAAELANAQFWVIAIPVFIGFIALLVIGAWIGWTMATTPPPKPIEEITTELDEKKEEAPATPVPPTEVAKPTEELVVKSSSSDVAAEVVQPSETKQEAKAETETISEPLKDTKERESKIVDVEGIGPVYAKKLNENNIYTTTDLLEAGATPQKRKELSRKTEISDQILLKWINMADLFRIRGVGEEYSDLLEASGVDTVVELSKRVPENLHAKMLQVNSEKNLVRRPPALSEVTRWVGEAKELPRRISY
jgi:predicted flap endonuclease-1-like 5' DNA nuclease